MSFKDFAITASVSFILGICLGVVAAYASDTGAGCQQCVTAIGGTDGTLVCVRKPQN